LPYTFFEGVTFDEDSICMVSCCILRPVGVLPAPIEWDTD
jgi:hypothetical protein